MGGKQWAGSDREWLCMNVCVPESHAQSQDMAPLSAPPFISPVILEWYFSLILLIFISPQMRMFLDLSNASSAAGGKEGAFVLSPSPPLPSFALAALLLHITSYEADKNKHVFICIYWSGLQFG